VKWSLDGSLDKNGEMMPRQEQNESEATMKIMKILSHKTKLKSKGVLSIEGIEFFLKELEYFKKIFICFGKNFTFIFSKMTLYKSI